MPLIYAVEPFSDAIRDITGLIDEHWSEAGSFQDRFRRVIDYLAYQRIEDQGKLLTLTARDGTRLVGYVVGVLGYDMHRVTKDTPTLRVAAFSALVNYLQPAYRGYARSMTKAVEREVMARTGRVTTLSYRAKKVNRAADFYRAMRYEEVETTFTKIISPEGVGAVDAVSRTAEVA